MIRVRSHSILLRRTQALAWIELRKWELDRWDALVKEIIDSLQPPLFPQRNGSAFPRERPETPQKTSDSLDDLCVDELMWTMPRRLSWNEFFVVNTR